MARSRIGELLVAEGLLTESAVQRALGYQRLSGDRIKIGSILMNWDLVGEDVLLATLAKLHHCTPVTWQMLFATPMDTVRILPAAQAIRLGAIPWAAEKNVVRVAFANPSNLAAIDEVAALTGRRVVSGVTTEARLLQAHQKYYGRHVPLEYRPILQKLDRRTTSTLKVARDFRSSDLVETERESNGVPRPSGPVVGVPIRAEIDPFTTASKEGARVPLELPEFPEIPETPGTPETKPPGYGMAPDASADAPAPDAGPVPERRMSDPGRQHAVDAGEESLTDWVGHALSALTSESPSSTREDSASSAGVSDPALFGRDVVPLSDPGALLDDLPPTNALRDRPSLFVRRPASESAEAEALISEAHTRGIPASIPPFRRATDPTLFETSSELDSDDATVAGMWKPAPDESGGAVVDGNMGDVAGVLEPDSAAVSDTGSGARRREEIADSLLQGPLEALPRVLLLASGRTGVTGWRGRGPTLSAETVAAIRVPASEISIFSSVQQSGVPHFGAIDRAEWPGALAAIFGAAPPDCAIFPIRILDGVAAFLYADRLGAPMQYEDFAIVARAAATAANVLSRFLLRSDRTSFPVRS